MDVDLVGSLAEAVPSDALVAQLRSTSLFRVRYERLFGRRVDVISLGRLGHAAVLVDPNTYADLLERALA